MASSGLTFWSQSSHIMTSDGASTLEVRTVIGVSFECWPKFQKECRVVRCVGVSDVMAEVAGAEAMGAA